MIVLMLPLHGHIIRGPAFLTPQSVLLGLFRMASVLFSYHWDLGVRQSLEYK
jgi:hypothetical protein